MTVDFLGCENVSQITIILRRSHIFERIVDIEVKHTVIPPLEALIALHVIDLDVSGCPMARLTVLADSHRSAKKVSVAIYRVHPQIGILTALRAVSAYELWAIKSYYCR